MRSERIPRIDKVVQNRLQPEDEAIHGWYRFVLGYPPHLVRKYLDILDADSTTDWVFDPFCGTATTPVEARINGFSTLSTDANPISILAARVKLTWDIESDKIHSKLEDVLGLATACLKKINLPIQIETKNQLGLFNMENIGKIDFLETDKFSPNEILPPAAAKLIPSGFISEKPLLRILALRYAIEKTISQKELSYFMLLALANTVVSTAGNVGFGPEVYRLPPKEDSDVFGAFSITVKRMVSDIKNILAHQEAPFPTACIYKDDARLLTTLEECPPIGIVITSPPYPNEKDYTRSTRLESVLLGLISTKEDLRSLKSSLLRSNTRNVFAGDNDDTYIKDIPSIVNLADEIERKRLELGKTSGFERLYHRVTRLYFGGMFRHLNVLRSRLRHGARCAYVVGDQMSYFRVHIQTAKLLSDVAIKAGYKVEGIDLWRTRRSTTTGLDLDENVLILTNP